MGQDLIFGFEIPVVLAFGMLLLVLLAVARVLAMMGKPQPVRHPSRMQECDIEQAEAAWRF